ncbi:MAG TPA: leucine--tRNA ligase [Candidatus Paceibacterota bacterium]
MAKYDHKKVERKWQKIWRKQNNFTADDKSKKEKLYVLDMFPYPSGSGLHVGHVEGYTATDIYSRFKRMQGYNVLHPMGWDAFGLPAENYAVKTGVHPKETTDAAIKAFRKQMDRMAFSYDWSREIGTHTPEYYKWTQWFFLLLYNNGLAYKAKASVNWCPSCQTVLANEQVQNGKCERCGTEVTQKELEQWFFKITEFAEDLIADLDKVDWPESTKLNQRNWIGKSEGATLKFEIRSTKSETNSKFKIQNSKQSIEVFTTRPDTLFGATYMVLAPEHPLVATLLETRNPKSEIRNKKEVIEYIENAAKKNEMERTELGKEKTGVELQGVKAINPANNEEIPVWVADYVLAGYGTGAIMAVPAHDERDFEFAEKFGLEIREVVLGGDIGKEAYLGSGVLVNSGKFDGMDSEKAKWEITKAVGGTKKTNYHLRDWLVSRQRYWGAPIPIVYDPEGKPHPVSEEHLPWLLPTDVEFKPTGYSPLADSKEFVRRTEKIFGKGWKPEVDTMDTFVCSSWYYFRFANPGNGKEFASKEAVQKWLPVDMYVGGAEHTVLHLMYARFFTKVLHKLGYVDFVEPFQKLRHPGTILAENGQKMSKSKGNVVNPDDIIEEYGADTLRMFEMFLGPLEDMKPWNTKSIVGLHRFLNRIWNFQFSIFNFQTNPKKDLENLRHKTIKKVTEDIDSLRFNTAIAALMECSNALGENVSKKDVEMLIILLAPVAPYMTEELWQQLGHADSVHSQKWPQYDAKKVQEIKIRLILQINGKVRDVVEVDAGIQEAEAKKVVLESEKVKKWLTGTQPKKVIFVPGKLVNIVV